MWLDRVPFRFRLFSVGALAMAALTVVFALSQASLVETALIGQTQLRAESERPLFRAVLTNLMVERDYATIEAILQESASTHGFAHLALVDARGETVSCIGWEPAEHGVPHESKTPIVGPDGTARLPFAVAIDYAGQKLGTLYYGVSIVPIQAARAEVLSRAAAIGTVSLVLALMMMEWLHTLLMRPLVRLRAASDAVRDGNFDVDLETADRDDFGRLAQSFRLMTREIAARIRALEGSEAAQRRMLDEARLREIELAQARDRAEAAAEAKARFLATMSHEIRTPLNGVLGLSSVLLGTNLEPEQRRLLQLVQGSGEQLLGIVNDVLDYSRLDANGLAVDAAPFDPQRLTRDTAAAFQPRAAAKDLTLTCWIDADVPPLVSGDALRVRQILDNLIGNAVKFTLVGAVDLRLHRTAGGALEWAVQDTGIGIPEARIPELFQDFAQVDSSATRRFGGSGLGLAIARRLARLMGGDITVESVFGRGSTFLLRLPLAALPQPREAAPALPAKTAEIVPLLAARGQFLRVLVAEDNAVNRLVIEKLLENLGHAAIFAEDGFAAIAAASSQPFDAILMDIQMPGLDGLSAFARIRDTPGPNSATPVFAVTANALPGDRDTYIAAGMAGYLPKPLDANALAALLAAIPRSVAQQRPLAT
ncbi:MAG: response regulator [Telmatospirillum sp.]|nr:response regulator [Telmatospirillum sp.]